jgi:hypothetical protein
LKLIFATTDGEVQIHAAVELALLVRSSTRRGQLGREPGVLDERGSTGVGGHARGHGMTLDRIKDAMPKAGVRFGGRACCQ